MYDDVIERLRSVRREASLSADEVAAIDQAIEQIEHLTGLAAEYLDMVVREQKRYVEDTDKLFLARKDAERELRDRELHHFEAEKALTDLLALSWAITRDSHCSHLGADIRFLIPADVLSAHSTDPSSGVSDSG